VKTDKKIVALDRARCRSRLFDGNPPLSLVPARTEITWVLDRVGALKHPTHLVELSERSESVVMSCLEVGMLSKRQYLLELMALFPRANR